MANNPWWAPAGLKRGQVNLIYSGTMNVLPNEMKLHPMNDSVLDALADLIEERNRSGQLTDEWKYKLLLNVCYPIGRTFQFDRERLEQSAGFQRLVAWTDTWEDPWIKVFKRHGLMSDLSVGFDTRPPYYGHNSYLISVGSLLT